MQIKTRKRNRSSVLVWLSARNELKKSMKQSVAYENVYIDSFEVIKHKTTPIWSVNGISFSITVVKMKILINRKNIQQSKSVIRKVFYNFSDMSKFWYYKNCQLD
jgi:hypothetical protein